MRSVLLSLAGLSDVAQVIIAIFTLVTFCGVCLLGFGYYKKHLQSLSKEAEETYARLYKAKSEEVSVLNDKVKRLERAYFIQEKFRVQQAHASKRRDMRMEGLEREIDYSERLLGIFYASIDGLPTVDKKRIESLRRELTAFKRQKAKELSEWEADSEAYGMFVDGDEYTTTNEEVPL